MSTLTQVLLHILLRIHFVFVFVLQEKVDLYQFYHSTRSCLFTDEACTIWDIFILFWLTIEFCFIFFSYYIFHCLCWTIVCIILYHIFNIITFVLILLYQHFLFFISRFLQFFNIFLFTVWLFICFIYYWWITCI